MRLIDADAFEVISWSAKGQTAEYERGHDDGISFMAARIDRQPTIDAIPVEWILEETKDNYDFSGTIARGLISEWRKEQEAR